MSTPRGFSLDSLHPPSSPNSPTNHVQFDDRTQSSPNLERQTSSTSQRSFRSTDDAPSMNHSPVLKRRQTRASTMRSNRAVSHMYPVRPQWEPGQEPGLDPSKPNGGRVQKPELHEACDITIVDYSEDDMLMYHLDNATLPGWLEKHGKREPWAKCRWINVNGLSWDVIQDLGKWKRLHRLAIEDLINTRNRTKADWQVSL
jgi:hypothetical protein